jgi:catechol 2,3-dioxygenase-like lactoylglutathione lyase family enzyme
MAFRVNHIHLKAPDPGKTADWYVRAFGFTIVSDEVRATGDRFVRCKSQDGTIINISGAQTGQQMNSGDAATHWGLEHFGIDSADLEADIKRLTGLGAELLEGPRHNPVSGQSIAFVRAPDDVRIELIQPGLW